MRRLRCSSRGLSRSLSYCGNGWAYAPELAILEAVRLGGGAGKLSEARESIGGTGLTRRTAIYLAGLTNGLELVISGEGNDKRPPAIRV